MFSWFAQRRYIILPSSKTRFDRYLCRQASLAGPYKCSVPSDRHSRPRARWTMDREQNYNGDPCPWDPGNLPQTLCRERSGWAGGGGWFGSTQPHRCRIQYDRQIRAQTTHLRHGKIMYHKWRLLGDSRKHLLYIWFPRKEYCCS